jgi:hypothetical protein
MKTWLSMLTLIVFVGTAFTHDLRAADAGGQSQTEVRLVSGLDLHKSVQAAESRAREARAGMRAFLARTEVSSQIRRMGLSPDRLAAQLATLSDAEILRLHQQTMNAKLQGEAAGLSKGAIWAIVLAGIAATILINVLLWPE